MYAIRAETQSSIIASVSPVNYNSTDRTRREWV